MIENAFQNVLVDDEIRTSSAHAAVVTTHRVT